MANHKSAAKRSRQNIKRNLGNRGIRAAVRTSMKKTKKAVALNQVAEISKLLKESEQAIARAAAKGIYHKNNAARKISRLARAANKASQA